MKTPYKLAALLIVALVFSAAECAASCAFTICNPANAASGMPPCHRHSQPTSHQNPAPCGHEFQLLSSNASISQDSISGSLIAAVPAPAVIESRPALVAEALHVRAASPPKLRKASTLILRI